VLGKVERLKILALLAERPRYISELARELRMPYPLVHLHLKALEEVGLVEGDYELVTGARPHVRKYYRVREFELKVTPELLKQLVRGGMSEA